MLSYGASSACTVVARERNGAAHPSRRFRCIRYHLVMELQRFFPYRLAVLADVVSRAIAGVYGPRFDLGRDEWRVLAALAEGPMKTGEVIAHTTLDKMQVSRAVARLEGNGPIEREADSADRRARVLRLTSEGRTLFRRIAPLAQAREAFLLEALDADERRVLD